MILERQGETDAEADEMNIVEDHFAMRLKEAGYDPPATAIHIPTAIAAAWFGEAVGERKGSTAVTRMVRQLWNEGTLKMLRVNPARVNGRGLLWNPGASEIDYGLADNIRFRQQAVGGNR
jgi:hypothetical protein